MFLCLNLGAELRITRLHMRKHTVCYSLQTSTSNLYSRGTSPQPAPSSSTKCTRPVCPNFPTRYTPILDSDHRPLYVSKKIKWTPLDCLLIWECLLIVNLNKRSKTLTNTKDTLISALAPQGPRKGEEEHTHRHTLKAHIEEERTRVRSAHVDKE